MYSDKRELQSRVIGQNGRDEVFHLGSLFHETVLHDPAIPLSKYIELLNTIIKKSSSQ